jgi:uncharacterized protein
VFGTLLNVGAIIAGSVLGVAVGRRLPDRIRFTVVNGLGLIVALVGLKMALETKDVMIVLGAVVVGGIMGELLHLHDGLEKLGTTLQSLIARQASSSFGEGFVTATLIFCIGPMAILGSIQDGLTGDFRLLAIKSSLDCILSIAFAASLGWGVAFSAISILIYQGSITLFAAVLSRLLTDPMITEMTAAGGLIVVGLGLKLLEIKELRLANFLPALIVAPLIVALIPIVRAFWA